MNSQTQRAERPPEGELVSPLSGPSYGPFNVVRQRWRKPIPAIIADALANNQAILARFKFGVWPPDEEGRVRYRKIFDELRESTRQQIKALEAFSAVEWREREDD